MSVLVVPRVFGGTLLIVEEASSATISVTATGYDGTITGIGQSGQIGGIGYSGQLTGIGQSEQFTVVGSDGQASGKD